MADNAFLDISDFVKDLRKYLSQKSSDQISRILKRLKLHEMIKKATKSYKYYLTKMGKEVA